MITVIIETKNYSELVTGDVFSWGAQVAWFERLADGSDAPIVPGHGLAGMDVGEVVHVPAGSGLAAQVHNLRETATRANEARREFEAWKAELVSDAHTYADEHSLCGEFDRFMEEHGLPTRQRDYNVTISLTVSARNEDEAVEQVSSNYYYTSDLTREAYVEVDDAA